MTTLKIESPTPPQLISLFALMFTSFFSLIVIDDHCSLMVSLAFS